MPESMEKRNPQALLVECKLAATDNSMEVP